MLETTALRDAARVRRLRRHSTQRLAGLGLLVVSAMLLTQVASAGSGQSTPGIPNAQGVYAACHAKEGGAMRLVPTFRRCRASEHRATWNRQGQPGQAGPQGATGERGPAGPTGATGATGATGPAGPAGPQGDPGAQGAPGPQGLQGDPGPQGDPGAQGAQGDPGPAGSQLVTGTPVTSAANASRHTLVTATATCPAGKVVLGGGALVTTTANQKDRAQLASSYPSSTTTWTAIGVVSTANLGNGQTMTVTAYALCSL